MLWKVVEQVLLGGLEAGVSIDFSSSNGKRWVSTQRYSSDPLTQLFGTVIGLLGAFSTD